MSVNKEETPPSSSSPITLIVSETSVENNNNNSNSTTTPYLIEPQIGSGSGSASGSASNSFQNDNILYDGNIFDPDFGFYRPDFRQNVLLGSVQYYDRHVFLCYKNPLNWPPRIEAAEFDRLPRLLSAALAARKPLLNKQTRLTICEGRDGTETSNGDVLIFPDMIRYRRLTHFDVDTFVEEVLVKDGEWLPGNPEKLKGYYIFVCCHGSRDRRCGVCGPPLVARFKDEVDLHGLQGKVSISPCSHVGGHKYAGNVIIFGSATTKKPPTLAHQMTSLPAKFLLLLSSLLLLTSLPILVISQSTSSSEEEILLKIKQQWGNQAAMQSWKPNTSHCEWHGIKCSDGETVTGIRLHSENIKGEIPTSICDLKNLTSLDLGDNYISGSFPKILYNCTKLQNLVLFSNVFVGKLPNDINKLSPDLQYIDLSVNNFTGDIPSSLAQLKGLMSLHLNSNLFNGTFPTELGNLENLEELVLAYNPFSPANLPKHFGMLNSLKYLRMTQCNLIGEIPTDFANLTTLEHLDLVDNNLVGEIPSGLFLLNKLQFFYLYKNRLSGEIPTSIQAFNLVEFDVSENSLTGIISQHIGNLTKLEVLNLFQNHFHGTIPPNIALLPSLKQFKIFSNRFSGTLPSEFGLHSKLEHFEVPDNAFTGPLPQNLCSGGKLLGVIAFNNYLNGTIPSSLSKCKSLLSVMLYNNSLSGEVPLGIWTLQHMMNMQLSSNQFSGQLPEKLATNLSRVEISNNRFSGKIPSVITWKNLEVFKATNNMITGPVPLELTKLSRLSTLLLDRNRITGELPSEIISWQSLSSLDLADNQLSGSIPEALATLPVLNYLDLSNNQLSGQIPPNFGQLRAPSLNLSSNKLTGKIPAEYDNSAYNTSFLNTHLCSDTGVLDLPKCSMNQRNLHFSTKYLALIIVLAFVAFLVTSYFIVFIISEIKRRKINKNTSWILTPFHKVEFTEEKIVASLSENNVIGFGGFGKVYRIIINQSGDAVAVKRIWNNKKMSINSEKEFIAEFQILGTIRHLNIVKLLCCLSCEDSKLLVYEYMENQSLDKWIHENKTPPAGSVYNRVLDWPARLKIAMDSAQGLCYMHHDCSPPIIHRDVKSSNILLDSKFNAKIADFGLAKILAKPGGGPHTVSAVAGSFGYMAPEYCYTTKVNEKIDIYSFGVVLLELVTGKEPHIGDEHTNLAEWAWRHYSEGHSIADVLDKQVVEPSYLREMTNVFKIGLMCTSTVALSRPSMKEVVQLLRRCRFLGDSGLAKSGTNDRDVSPLLGGNSFISSCKNSKRTTEDDLDMV